MPSQDELRAPITGIRLHLLNTVPNVFWSVLFILPVYLFCSAYSTAPLLCAFGCVSLVPYLVPVSVIDRMILSSSPAIYRRLGVAIVNRVTQDGVLVRKFAGPRHDNRFLVTDRAIIARLRGAAFQRERFHLAAFLFFLLLTARAVWLGKFGWAFLLLTSNIIYNAYPILLQHYIRLRLYRIARRQGLV